MPVVHSSASALSTAGVFFSHGPSSKVSTTSFSFRKSNSLKCSKPKPGPPVVSTSTVRATPSAFGLLQAARAGCAGWAGAAAAGADAAGAGAAFWAAAWDQATEGAQSKAVTTNPAATRILIFPRFSKPISSRLMAQPRAERSFPQGDTNPVGPAAPRQRPPGKSQ